MRAAAGGPQRQGFGFQGAGFQGLARAAGALRAAAGAPKHYDPPTSGPHSGRRMVWGVQPVGDAG